MSDKVWFEDISDKQVFCILSEPNIDTKKLVVMSHGFRGTSIGPARTFVDFSRILVENGYSVLRFDQINSANSEDDYIDSSFFQWVKTITYLVNKYIKLGYEVTMLGQSMGATATMIATNQKELRGKIKKIILWVPDPETDFSEDPAEIGEEGGQLYSNKFWQEAKDMDFFGCLDKYEGQICLVYGEHDKYVAKELRDETIEKVKQKGGMVSILPGQDHSPWDFDLCQKVYKQEVDFLKK